MKQTKNNHARFFALLAKLPGADKEELVWTYSNMLTTSLSEFREKNYSGYKAMLDDLQKKVPQPKAEEIDREQKRLRSSVLLRLQKHGVDTTDWNTVNKFLESDKIAGKRLYAMTNDELQALIPKLESILRKDAIERERLRYQQENN